MHSGQIRCCNVIKLLVSNVLHCDCGIWGEGKKFYVLTKCVEKKIHFCLVWGFFNDCSNQGGWVFIVIPLLICFIMILYWLLNHSHGCCAHMTCAGWVYILGGGKKLYVLTKHVKNTFLFSLGIFQ